MSLVIPCCKCNRSRLLPSSCITSDSVVTPGLLSWLSCNSWLLLWLGNYSLLLSWLRYNSRFSHDSVVTPICSHGSVVTPGFSHDLVITPGGSHDSAITTGCSHDSVIIFSLFSWLGYTVTPGCSHNFSHDSFDTPGFANDSVITRLFLWLLSWQLLLLASFMTQLLRYSWLGEHHTELFELLFLDTEKTIPDCF